MAAIPREHHEFRRRQLASSSRIAAVALKVLIVSMCPASRAAASSLEVRQSFTFEERVRAHACLLYPEAAVGEAAVDLSAGTRAEYLGPVKIDSIDYVRIRPWTWTDELVPADVYAAYRENQIVLNGGTGPNPPIAAGQDTLSLESRSLCVLASGFPGVAKVLPTQRRLTPTVGALVLPIKYRLKAPSVTSDLNLAIAGGVRLRLRQSGSLSLVLAGLAGASRLTLGIERTCVASSRTTTSVATDDATGDEVKTVRTEILDTCPQPEVGSGLSAGFLVGLSLGPAEFGLAYGRDWAVGKSKDRWVDRDTPTWFGVGLAASGGILGLQQKKQ